MISVKKKIAGCAAVLALTFSSVTAYASQYQSPADAAAGVTGKTLESVVADRQAGKSYGAIAAEAGKLMEFQQSVLDIHRSTLDTRVANGTISQEEAAIMLDAIAQRQAICNGSGLGNGTGFGVGMGYGCGMNNGRGMGNGRGTGYGRGRGMGYGMRNGTCLYQ